ncbi:fumarylacetoacetase [Bradyrhizobium sp. CCBAU 65884]|uniref:fumarylacetoacetase n=1 Tax=Bradyrhizobium sp. CCBAU 65884 TaxID=722477 RepID=UPI00230576BE|nr:fumarylacetoacetase [Bradyrhizobium sp. CCBAU 65884]MDA9478099.1 fumarylacetoacetase [Bradyrhizobium sp. CCBAU 65884]
MTSTDLDRSHDPLRLSWVTSANLPNSDFPVQNLPFGVFRETGSGNAPRGCVAIGGHVLDVAAVSSLLGEVKPIADTLIATDLRPLMSLAPRAWTALRLALSDLLSAGNADHRRVERHLHASDGVEMFLPVRPGSFVDFFASIQHATNAGSIFRPTAPLLPNYKYVPVAYNGRASTIVVSGSPVSRPAGQTRVDGQEAPSFGPSQRLDFETELGVFIGGYSERGRPVTLREAWRHVFGFCLLNDWSARDIQAWEYQPLGPFLGKSFATTISPWVVTADALRPFRVRLRERPTGDPAPLPHLADDGDSACGAVDVMLETRLATTRMLKENAGSAVLGRTSTRELYWSVGQMVAHLTSNGCNIEAGDLFGSGTVSGDAEDALGSLLEITRAGKEPLQLPGGEQRTFLEDGDEIVITGRCARNGFAPIGFGRCAGRITASPAG